MAHRRFQWFAGERQDYKGSAYRPAFPWQRDSFQPDQSGVADLAELLLPANELWRARSVGGQLLRPAAHFYGFQYLGRTSGPLFQRARHDIRPGQHAPRANPQPVDSPSARRIRSPEPE